MTPPNNEASAPKWRFEALDSRAGLAFAAWRPSRATSTVVDDWPCLFFSPPGFVPEPVGNIAFALGATHGSFAPGLLVGDEEAFFETPEEVAEFVRRGYINSAGGDGADGGGGGGPVPLPPEPPPDLPGPGEGSLEVSREYGVVPMREMIWEDIRRISGISAELKPGQSVRVRWMNVDNANAVESIVTGALHILHELLMRKPPSGSGDRLFPWSNDIRALGTCMRKLSLWPGTWTPRQTTWADRMLDYASSVADWHGFPLDGKMALFLSNGATLDDEEFLTLLNFHYGNYPPYVPMWMPLSGDPATYDPIELLRRFPLPGFAAKCVAGDLDSEASLYHLLSVFTAGPDVIKHVNGRDASAIIDLVLFACGCVVTCADGADPQPVYRYPGLWSESRRTRANEAAKQYARAASEWLKEHLPRVVFAPNIEKTLSRSKDIRYAMNETA